MKLSIQILTILFLLNSSTVYGEIIDRIVAVVNDNIITESTLNAAIASRTGGLKEGESPIEVDVNTKSFILDTLIEKQLMKQTADKEGIDVSEIEIDKAIEDIQSRSGLTQDELLVELAKTGLTYKQYRSQLKEDIRQSKFMGRKFRSGINITETDLREFYTQNISQFQKSSTYRISIILLKNNKKTKTIMDKLNSGEDFAMLATKHSTGAGKEEGGDLGYFELTELDSSLKSAIEGMKVGEVRGPITSKDGVRIIKLTDIGDGEATSLEDVASTVKDMLYKAILKEKYNHWLNKIKGTAHIEVRL